MKIEKRVGSLAIQSYPHAPDNGAARNVPEDWQVAQGLQDPTQACGSTPRAGGIRIAFPSRRELFYSVLF
jgi:hypothetical protein